MTTLLLAIGIVHLHLWQDGYRTLPTVGPLFVVAVVSAAVIALFASVQINWVTAMAAAGFSAGTLAANILSLLLPRGLACSSPYQMSSGASNGRPLDSTAADIRARFKYVGAPRARAFGAFAV